MAHVPALRCLEDERDPFLPRRRDFFPLASPTAILLRSWDERVVWMAEHGMPVMVPAEWMPPNGSTITALGITEMA